MFSVPHFPSDFFGSGVICCLLTVARGLDNGALSEIACHACHELRTQVVSIVPYGAFVNIEGNIDGLVHISEMAMGRVDSVEDVVQVPVSKHTVLHVDTKSAG